MDKLNADMRLFQSYFGADRSIDQIRSDEIEDFLDSKKAASRRRNNLRSEIITLFRYAQIRLRALHRDRKTEAELVLRDQTKRKPVVLVETFRYPAAPCTVRGSSPSARFNSRRSSSGSDVSIIKISPTIFIISPLADKVIRAADSLIVLNFDS